jgi:Flp pilus assembly pilin Flp
MASKIATAVRRLPGRIQLEGGQTLPEYGLILALVSVAAIVALGLVAAAITGTLGFITSAMTSATSGS